MWKIGTWKTIRVWVMEKNGRNGIPPLQLSEACCGALQFWCCVLCCIPKKGVWYVVLVLCSLQCHPLLVEKVLEIVGKVPQPSDKKKVHVECVCRQVCNVPLLHIGQPFFLYLTFEVRK